jgi:hypothetical protein
LDALQPTDFKDQIDGYRGARSGRISKDAITSLDRMLERVKRLYVLGDFDEERYRAERDRLLGQRAQLAAAGSSAPTVRLDGLLAAWNSGDPITRRQLLTALFDALYVRDGQIVEVKPREDRASEVADLLDQLDAQPNGICCMERRGSGEGGIRTPDSLAAIAVFETAAINRTRPPLRVATPKLVPNCSGVGFAGGPDRIRTGVLGLDRAACLARLHHGTVGPEVYQLRNRPQTSFGRTENPYL